MMKDHSGSRSILTLSLLILLFAGPLFHVISVSAQQSNDQRSKSGRGAAVLRRDERGAAATTGGYFSRERPSLVLLIAVDQFRYDYLTRFGDLFGKGGLRRLLDEGAVWTNANYDHVPTYTAPGHATLLTGTWPAENGIVGNDWYDRDTGKSVTSVSDEGAKLLGGTEGEAASSPKRLMASTIGDELRLLSAGRSKVIGISIKDRAAILPSGRRATAAYWFSAQAGGMVSSNYYFPQLPAWVAAFNQSRPADKYFGSRWERLLDHDLYLQRAGADVTPWLKDDNSFPHVVTGGANAPGKAFYDALDATPFANDLLLSFAEQAIVNEKLGADADTDVLSVSFSANDYVGHRFGPYSQEVMDMTLRVDRQIAALLDFVDAKVGLNNVVVAFSADHGVAPNPDQAASMGLPGGLVKPTDVLTVVRDAVDARYGRDKGSKEPGKEYVQTFVNGNIYFNLAALERDHINRSEIERLAGEAAMTVPGITRYFTRTQLTTGGIPANDSVARRVQHGFYPRRSGDVILIQEAFKYLQNTVGGATHGSPYSYDTHVPLIIMGAGVKAGVYAADASPADIAPTLAQILRVQAPSNSTGRVLTEGLRQ